MVSMLCERRNSNSPSGYVLLWVFSISAACFRAEISDAYRGQEGIYLLPPRLLHGS